jgi:hypothetical protein
MPTRPRPISAVAKVPPSVPGIVAPQATPTNVSPMAAP